MLKTVSTSITEMKISFVGSPLSLTRSQKLFITQMHDHSFGLIRPRQVHAEYKMHTCRDIYIYTNTTWRVTSSVPMEYRHYMYSSVADLMAGEAW